MLENEPLDLLPLPVALQEICFMQPALIVGLIAILTGHVFTRGHRHERQVVVGSRGGHSAPEARESSILQP